MKEIDLEQLKIWQRRDKSFQLIDVREANEHEQFNIGGILIPLSELSQHLRIFEQSTPIVLYCKRGIRSQIAIQRLHRLHIKGEFVNLRGGILPLMSPQSDKDKS